MGLGKSLKGKFGSYGGVGIHFGHKVDISEVQKMINKDSCTNTMLKCGVSPMGRNKTRGRTNQLVHADSVSHVGSLTKVTTIMRATGAPRSVMHFAISTARAHRRRDGGQVRRNDASTSMKSQAGEAEMPKALMECSKTSLFVAKKASQEIVGETSQVVQIENR